tara:strand:+ start:919 stop:2271 length:1353 start_codon:yes stop_codon:yes gene_type:complete
MRKLKFVDLFAGLGGFHIGLSKLGHECIYACEIDKSLNEHYAKNFTLDKEYIWGDVRTIPNQHIKYLKENADMICAGFPCQPFSKAGTQSGFNHLIAGDMFQALFDVINKTKPEFIFLENVPNLLSHDQGKTYNMMKLRLTEIGYNIKETVLSPLDFNYPQTRKRLYIFGIYKKKNSKNDLFRFPVPIRLHRDYKSKTGTFILKNKTVKYLEIHKAEKIDMYQDLLNMLENKIGSMLTSETIINPLWVMEFGAKYPYTKKLYFNKNLNNFIGSIGSFGKKIKMQNGSLINLPPYALTKKEFPLWKQRIIKKNRNFMNLHKDIFNKWIKKYKVDKMLPSYQKFEWNAHSESLDFKNKLISFRPSGIRVRRIYSAPTLITQTTTQIPIIATHSKILKKKYRYISYKEALRLQGFSQNDLKYVNQFRNNFYPAIGNAVNVHIIKKIAKEINLS